MVQNNDVMMGQYLNVDLQAQQNQVVQQVDQFNGLAGDAGRKIKLRIVNGKDQQGNVIPYDLTGMTVALCVVDAQGKPKISRMMERDYDQMGLCSITVPAPFYQAEGQIKDGYIGVFSNDNLNTVIGSMPITFSVRHNALLVGTGNDISESFDSQFGKLTIKADNLNNLLNSLVDSVGQAQSTFTTQLQTYSDLIKSYQKSIDDKQVATKDDVSRLDGRIDSFSDVSKQVDKNKEDIKTLSSKNTDLLGEITKNTNTNNKQDISITSLWDSVNPLKQQNTKWSDWTHDGAYMSNGAKKYSNDNANDIFYRVRYQGGNKQYQLKFTASGIWSSHKDYIFLPPELRAKSNQFFAQPCRDNDLAMWVVNGTILSLHANSANKYDNPDWYTFNAVIECD